MAGVFPRSPSENPRILEFLVRPDMLEPSGQLAQSPQAVAGAALSRVQLQAAAIRSFGLSDLACQPFRFAEIQPDLRQIGVDRGRLSQSGLGAVQVVVTEE